MKFLAMTKEFWEGDDVSDGLGLLMSSPDASRKPAGDLIHVLNRWYPPVRCPIDYTALAGQGRDLVARREPGLCGMDSSNPACQVVERLFGYYLQSFVDRAELADYLPRIIPSRP